MAETLFFPLKAKFFEINGKQLRNWVFEYAEKYLQKAHFKPKLNQNDFKPGC